MDDRKAIPMMDKFFEGIAKETFIEDAQTGKITEDDTKSKPIYFAWMKTMTAFVDWYDKVRSAKGWVEGVTKDSVPIVKKLPTTTGIESLELHESKVLPILDDFNSRNIPGEQVMEYFDSYLNRIKYGWNRKIREIKERG